MKKWLHGFATLLFISVSAHAAPLETPSLAQIIKGSRDKSMVLARGKVAKALSFDSFVLDDGTAKILLDLSGRNHQIKADDALVIYGRLRTNPSLQKYDAEIKVKEWVLLSDQSGVNALTERYGSVNPPPASPQVAPISAAPSRDIASRLKDLEKLKEQNLITPDEYQEQRKRILNDL